MKTTNPHERQNLEALAVFQLLDKVDEMNGLLKAAKAQEYERNSEVSVRSSAANDTSLLLLIIPKAEIRNFSRAFLLNPELAFYSADSTLKVNVVVRNLADMCALITILIICPGGDV